MADEQDDVVADAGQVGAEGPAAAAGDLEAGGEHAPIEEHDEAEHPQAEHPQAELPQAELPQAEQAHVEQAEHAHAEEPEPEAERAPVEHAPVENAQSEDPRSEDAPVDDEKVEEEDAQVEQQEVQAGEIAAPAGELTPIGPAEEGARGASGGGGSLRASAELKAIVEALIFASPDPLTRKAIGKLLTSEPAEDIDAALDELKSDYERPGGLQLVEVAGGYQIVTRSDLHEWVRRLFHERTTQKLTVQALETLAVIAYRQPVTGLEVTDIRGVTAAGVLNTLLERHLIKIVGRKKVVGRPFLYATTKEFLIRFGLNEISDLPKVEDMAEALGFEPPLLIEHAASEETLPLEEPELSAAEPPEDENPNGSVH